MRYGTNVKYNLSQKELWEVVSNVHELEHVDQGMFNEIFEMLPGSYYMGEPHTSFVEFYNRIYLHGIGLKCRLCGKVHNIIDDFSTEYRFVSLEESYKIYYDDRFPTIRLTSPDFHDSGILPEYPRGTITEKMECGPFCFDCFVKYRKYANSSQFSDWECSERKRIPLRFLIKEIKKLNN